ncbi:MAG: electron transport complex subunit E [Alphaproteobacteria bacterium]|nr:electron transport complex subunit E [Alphaproteobacteria bacterium]
MPNTPRYGAIVKEALYDNNVVFGQMLALCPTLAVTSTATNGLGMGLATTFVLGLSNAAVALLRNFITPEVRIPAYVLIIATLVTVVDMAMNAWLHDLYQVLGLFIPLIVVNCAVLGRAETFASRNPVLPSVVDGLATGAGFAVALMLVGGVREVLGSGTLFANASSLLGPAFSFLEVTVVADYGGFLLFVLPPGGFLVVGFLLAAKRVLDRRLERLRVAKAAAAAAEAA